MTQPTARPSWSPATCAAVWHPFTQHARWPDDEPLVVDRAEGMHLVGHRRPPLPRRRLLAVGHRARPPACPRSTPRSADQLDRLDHTTFLGLHPRAGHRAGRAAARDRAGRADPGRSTPATARRPSRPRSRWRTRRRRSAAQQRPLYAARRRGLPRRHPRRGQRRRHRRCSTRPTARSCSTPAMVVVARRPARRARPGRRAPPRCSPRCAPLLEREGDQVCAVVVEPMVQAAGGMLTHDVDVRARRARRCATSSAR